MRFSESMLGAAERAYCRNAVLESDWDTAEYFSDRQLAGLAQHAKEQIDNDYIKKSPCEYPGICRPAIVTVVIVIGDSYIYCIVWWRLATLL